MNAAASYAIPPMVPNGLKVEDQETMEQIRSSQIGRLGKVSTPFGIRPLVYCDWTASGRGLKMVERLINDTVLPVYGNTHTAASLCGAQSSAFVAEARQAVGEFVGARTTGKAAEDIVLFAGNGATGAVCQLVSILGVNTEWTVFVGPYEHHSNLLPWRETGATIVTIAGDERNGLDLRDLSEKLVSCPSSKKLGAFAAASNASGRITDVEATTALLRAHHALCCWDFATMAAHCAPRVASLDACYFSCHKLLGGVGATGVLVLKKRLVSTDTAPSAPGGGTVLYVTKTAHHYLSNRIEREQGGTPNVPGIVRAGAAVQIARLLRQETSIRTTFLAAIKSVPCLVVLGALGNENTHLPIFPIMIRCGRRWLHYSFVCQVLNDVFGIQCRGGCQCAAPYAHELLGIGADASTLLQNAIVGSKDCRVLRPGFIRISFGSTFAHNSPLEIEYAAKALVAVARYGWRLLPLYRVEPRTGEWRHASRFSKPLGDTRKWFVSALFNGAGAAAEAPVTASQEHERDYFMMLLHQGERVMKSTDLQTRAWCADSPLDDAFEPLRWFVTPAEASRRFLAYPDYLEWPAEEPLDGPIRPPGCTSSCFTACHSSGIRLENGDDSRAVQEQSRRGESLFADLNVHTQSRDALVPLHPTVPNLVAQRIKPPKRLLKPVGEAIFDWKMISDGDRILLGLSGGKDSLSLLHILMHLQRIAPVTFELACATVDPVTPSFDPSPLIPYVEGLGIKYYYLRDHIVEYATQIRPISLCSYCARMKRGALYTCALENGYNVLALAQHLDDLAESFVMNTLHNGSLRTMRAKYVADKGVTVIRPLVYAREHLMADFARQARNRR